MFLAGTTTELAGVENSGTTFTAGIDADSVDIVIHSLGYEYMRTRAQTPLVTLPCLSSNGWTGTTTTP